ncbi:MAG TPA: di-heme oxidoredictase family protein [Methylomirabilota bacterium]|nr:di-heme oxidoredictase family protein [Methylomirabilota bacterium]
MSKASVRVLLAATVILLLGLSQNLTAQFRGARDPGVRGGGPGAGGPLAGIVAGSPEMEMFTVGLEDFSEEEGVADGVGPRFNFVGCAGCHAQPAVGGTSPADNPLFRLTGELKFAGNIMPSFITPNGPIREARFQFNSDGSRDGGVHALFVITGNPEAAGCNLKQEDFETQVRNRNIIFRIPTPVFGAGLIENIKDSTLVANLNANSTNKRNLGISGRLNRNGNDGRVSKFGWKAQNPSLLVFSGEAYNVEMGITNEAFPHERDETANCQFAPVPNDVTASVRQIGAIENFANFQRFLAPPTPVTSFTGASSFSIARGKQRFADVGCALCHTPSLAVNANASVVALRNNGQPANLYSDLALHQMGPGLADDILQGAARGDEFRTAPLWGLGKRIFFLHDGRTSDLEVAIQAHRSDGNSKFGPSEANGVISNFNRLSDNDQQDLLNFLRSL